MSPTYQKRVNATGSGLSFSGKNLSSTSSKLAMPVVAYLVLIVLPIQFNVGSIALSGSRALLMIMLVPLCFQLLRKKYGPILWTDVLFLLHVVWMAVSMYTNNPDIVVEYIGSTAIEFLGGYLLARAYIRSAEDFVALCQTLVLFGCLLIPFAIFESLTEATPILNLLDRIPGVSSLLNVKAEARMGLERAQVVFAHPIHFGLFCSVLFSLCFLGLKTVVPKKILYFCSFLLATGVFLSLASGALLALMLQLGLIFWAWTFERLKHKWLLLLGVFVVIYFIIDLFSNRAPIRVFMSYATLSAHTAYWRGIIFEWGMQNVWTNPMFGIGLNEWVRPIFMKSTSVDNFWLLTTMRYGIPGFLLLAVGYLISLYKIGTRNFDDDSMLYTQRRAWMFTFVGLTFTLLTVHIWGTIYSFVFFMFGAGMWFTTAQSVTRPINQEHERRYPAAQRADVLNVKRPASREPDRTAVVISRNPEEKIIYSRFVAAEKKAVP